LTTNHAGTVSAIQSMQPYNLTHISLGMEWGYHLLSPDAPVGIGEHIFPVGRIGIGLV
jgi:hypothetical protein